jgi:branched-chain amino acid transport system substrate-binding protein
MYRSISVLVTAALLASVAGCGTRMSDGDIVAALRAPVSVTIDLPASSAVPPPAEATTTGQALTPVDAPAAVAANPTTSRTKPVKAAKPAPQAPKPAATLAPIPTVADKSLVTVGTLGSFSGVLGAVTAGAPRTLQAWVANANVHGGLNGHPVKLIVADDQGDPATALTLAHRLVESYRVLALVGDVHFFGFQQIEQYMRSKSVPMIGGDAATDAWFTSPVAFPVSAPGAVQIIKGLKMYVDRGVRKFGMLYCLEVGSLCQYLNDQAKKSEVGQYILQSYQVSLVAPSYTSQCLRMKQGGLEAIYMLMDTASASRLVKDCATQGYTPKLMLLGLDATKDMPGIPVLGQALMPGATVSTGATDLPAVARLHQIIDTYAPSVGENGFGALAYAAAEMLGLVGKNLSANPTSAELIAALYRVKNETLGGLTVPLTYAKTGTTAAPCVFIWGVANGTFTAPEGSKPLC